MHIPLILPYTKPFKENYDQKKRQKHCEVPIYIPHLFYNILQMTQYSKTFFYSMFK